MNFEKRMKKHIDDTLDQTVPNPYPKKRAFPTWAKIVIPTASVALTASIALAVILPTLNTASETRGKQFFVAHEKASIVKQMGTSMVNRTATKTLQALDSYFAATENQNYVLSPASYLLAVSSVAAVSEGFDLAAFGLEDAEKDCKTLLESWNFRYENTDERNPAYCQFDSAILHQQVGNTYRFDAKKQEQIANDYIATCASSLKNYHDDATDYFHNKVGLTIPIPDPHLTADGVISYGAFKMKDYVPGGFGSYDADFHLGKKTIQVPSRHFGSVYWPLYVPYYKGENYQAFSMKINYTDLLFVLPDEGLTPESISLSSAYAEFMEHKHSQASVGYVPYFHLVTESVDITGAMAGSLTGKEKVYAKLLEDDVVNNLSLDSVLQTSDFEFNRYGVSGESITVVTYSGSSAPVEHQVVELKVDRPFYAISLKDDFPLFVNKVNDPSK